MCTASFAPKSHLTKYIDKIDRHWLPDLTGLPSVQEVDALDDKLLEVITAEPDKRCRLVKPQLRMLFFEHFLVMQALLNAQNIYFDNDIAKRWAHVMAMTIEESGGDSTNITDFEGHSFANYSKYTNLERWKKILTLSAQTKIKLNYQTNFGLTQTSADRLFVIFNLGKTQLKTHSFLEGLKGIYTSNRVKLNTTITVRRLVWFYQDFAEGRVRQEDKRIHSYDIKKPEFIERYQQGLDATIKYCGTRYMFADINGDKHALRDAVASVAYCKFGNAIHGYGKNVDEEKCFAQLVTLCPALNIDIALITPDSYFQTRGARPICEATFNSLILKKTPPFSIIPKKLFSYFGFTIK